MYLQEPRMYSNEVEGINNAMVYVTRKVNLKTPASSLRVIADVFRPPTTDVKVYV